MIEVRILAPDDEPLLADFFARHPDTTLFFQNNVAATGVSDRGIPYSGTYAAAFEDGALAALAAHYWQGNLVVEAPRHLEAVVRAAVAASGRAITGLLGPWSQVIAARRALGLADAPTTMDSPDELFALALERLRVPEPLQRGECRWRRPHDRELDVLTDWRVDYRVELMGQTRDAALRASARDEIERSQRDGRNFVLEVGGALVSYAGYNARTERCVQIGGVWTPPPLRGRGHARAAVAGALLAAREA
ncbi:MAG: GNAT family N-acetyltransferase, partial [Proteobacteria bacterium]